MIRKLKVGEVIKDGDFFETITQGRGYSTNISIGSKASGMVDLFRDIPDSHFVTNKDGSIGEFHIDDFENVSADTVKSFANWMLEIAEAME